jgi:Rad3-related DNA helicase
MKDNELNNIKNNILEWVEDNFGIDFEFRQYQLESIMFIIKSIITDNRETSIIEAPTGSGKSLITIIAAGVLSTYYELKSYILCSDLFLWQQYADIIDNKKLKKFGYLKGSIGNYTCFMNKQDLSNSRCRLMKISYNLLKDKTWCERNFFNCVNTCVYMQQRFRAERSDVTLLTYQLWLYFMNIVNTENKSFQTRSVIFCDECHNIPDIVQQFCSPVINDVKDKNKLVDILKYISEENLIVNNVENINDVYKYNSFVKEFMFKKIQNMYKQNTIHNKNTYNYNDIFDTDKIKNIISQVYEGLKLYHDDQEQLLDILNLYSNILNFINYICTIIQDNFDDKNIYNLKNLNNDDMTILKRLNWFNTYINSFNHYINAINTSGLEHLIMEYNYDSETAETVYQFNCAKEDYLVNQYVLKHAKNKVLLSATVGMHHAFDENLGIKYTEQKCSYLSKIPSTFNFDKSPIYFIPKYKMSYYNKNTDFPEIQKICFKILSATNKRGIIHTGSYENAKLFYNNAPKEIQKRLFLYGNSKQKEEIIKDFKNVTNGVLIGPTLTEGIDLPDDYCRFIILMKVPYPNITSKIVKKKIELFADWYNNTTSNIIIQSIGRGVRNENDYCITYILDGCFGNLYQQTKEQYPKYIQDRIKILYK